MQTELYRQKKIEKYKVLHDMICKNYCYGVFLCLYIDQLLYRLYHIKSEKSIVSSIPMRNKDNKYKFIILFYFDHHSFDCKIPSATLSRNATMRRYFAPNDKNIYHRSSSSSLSSR